MPQRKVHHQAVPGPNDTWKLPYSRGDERKHGNGEITAPAGGATSVFGSDMARVLDDSNVRVLTVLGKGPVHNVVDILYLKAIDMGVVVADVPEFYRLQYKFLISPHSCATSQSCTTIRIPHRRANFGQIDL